MQDKTFKVQNRPMDLSVREYNDYWNGFRFYIATMHTEAATSWILV